MPTPLQPAATLAPNVLPRRFSNILSPQRILSSYDSPLPLWMIFSLIFAALYIAHLPLLRLPYYWDEAGYYIPAAWDFFRTGSLIPSTTLSNAHPPLPSLYLALWWKLCGFTPLVTRTAMCLVAAAALLAVYRLAFALTGRVSTSAATVLLTGLYPVWFAQSALAHADLFAAAATLWGLAFALGAPAGSISPSAALPARTSWAAVFCFSLAVLSKETAIVTPMALALWNVWQALLTRIQNRGQLGPDSVVRRLLAGSQYLLPAIPLAVWYAYHYHETGFVFGNPQFLRYNATATLAPLRIVAALGHRILHITAHMNMFVPVLCTLAALSLPPRKEEDGTPRPRVSPIDQQRVYFVIGANLIFFSVIGGALLTRYLLPVYPLVLLLCVNTLRRRAPRWPLLIAISAAAFVAGLFVNPPYRFAPEDNLAYADSIRLQQRAIGYIQLHDPQPVVLTAWPASDELTKPELGYVRTPIAVVIIDNFSLDQIQKAAQLTEPYTVAFIFSTKYDPPHRLFSYGRRNEELDLRFFDYHRDLPTDAIAHLLGGEVAWRARLKGQSAAVLHFNRPQFGSLSPAP